MIKFIRRLREIKRITYWGKKHNPLTKEIEDNKAFPDQMHHREKLCTSHHKAPASTKGPLPLLNHDIYGKSDKKSVLKKIMNQFILFWKLPDYDYYG